MNHNQYVKMIETQVSELGVKESGVLMVYASLEALGKIEGGADTFIRGIRKVLGDKGTLLMATSTVEAVKQIENVGEFSAKDTPSESGIISEYFRKMPNVVRSINPTHSVCGIGMYSKELLDKHRLDRTSFGVYSPYKLISEIGGQILYVGTPLDIEPIVSGIEENLKPSYLVEKTVQYRIYNERREKQYIDFKHYELDGVEKNTERALALLEEKGEIKQGNVLEAKSFLINAKSTWKTIHSILKEDEMYLVTQINN